MTPAGSIEAMKHWHVLKAQACNETQTCVVCVCVCVRGGLHISASGCNM